MVSWIFFFQSGTVVQKSTNNFRIFLCNAKLHMFSAKIKQNITKPNLTASKDIPKGGGRTGCVPPPPLAVVGAPRAAGMRGPTTAFAPRTCCGSPLPLRPPPSPRGPAAGVHFL